MSVQDSYSPPGTLNSILPLPQAGQQVGGETGTPKGRGLVQAGTFIKTTDHQTCVQRRGGGTKWGESGNGAYEKQWKGLEVHIPFQREGISPPACSTPGSSHVGLGEGGPQLGVHTG